MKTKDYMKPTTLVVKLQFTGMLMASGVPEASRNSYGSANSGVDNSEKDGDGNWVWD